VMSNTSSFVRSPYDLVAIGITRPTATRSILVKTGKTDGPRPAAVRIK
jgi:hypothetical protein